MLTSSAYRIDPLDVRSMAERWLASKDAAAGKTLSATMYQHPATAQETAAEYLNAGLWQDGTATLLQMTASAPDQAKIHPMVFYYLAYFAEKLGQAPKAAAFRKQAMALAPDYVFPFQQEAIGVLEQAVKADAKDARARYYLGNLLYDWQPEAAMKLWEASAAIDPSLAMVHRNLATAYSHMKPAPDVNRAIAELEKAVACGHKYPLHFAELDELYEQAAVPLEKRLPLFERNAQVVAMRDDAQNRAIALMVAMGKYDDAIKAMSGQEIRPCRRRESQCVGALGGRPHPTRTDQTRRRPIPRGASRFRDRDEDSGQPSRIGCGRKPHQCRDRLLDRPGVRRSGRSPESHRLVEQRRGSQRRRRPARCDGRRQFQGGGAQSYYQALCLMKLGQADKAKSMFQELVNSGQRAMEQQPTAFAVEAADDRNRRAPARRWRTTPSASATSASTTWRKPRQSSNSRWN